MLDGIGEATCSTYRTPSIAASQPFGTVSSASTNDKASPGSLPPRALVNHCMTSLARFNECNVPRTL
jgi:hypothetical protein